MKLSAQIVLFPHVSLLEKSLFTKHLAVMIKAGIPLVESLLTLASQGKSVTLNQVLTHVITDVENGLSLASALSKHPRIFDTFYVSMIEVGEVSGTLEANLDFLSTHMAKEYALKKKVQGALLYPGVVFTATVIMGGSIALFVLPKLVTFFDAFEIELPLSTRILLGIATFMRDYGAIFFVGLALIFAGLVMGLQLKIVKPYWHRFMLRLPLFGPLLKYNQLARFARNLGVQLQSGVPITQALATTQHTLSNLAFQDQVQAIAQGLSKGQTMAQVLGKPHSAYFPELITKMIAVGEKTGKLEETLLYMATFYEEEIDSISKNLSTILEPVMLLFIGLVVGFVALAIIGPIYQLTGSIGT